MLKRLLFYIVIISGGLTAKGQHFDVSKIIFSNVHFTTSDFQEIFTKYINPPYSKVNINTCCSLLVEKTKTVTPTNQDRYYQNILLAYQSVKNNDMNNAIRKSLAAKAIADKTDFNPERNSLNLINFLIYSEKKAYDLQVAELKKCVDLNKTEQYQISFLTGLAFASSEKYSNALAEFKNLITYSQQISAYDHYQTLKKICFVVSASHQADAMIEYGNEREIKLSELTKGNIYNDKIIYTDKPENIDAYIQYEQILINNDLGTAYRYKKDYLNSEKYFSESSKRMQMLPQSPNKNYIYNNLGLTYTLMEKYPQANNSYKMALKGYELENNKEKIAETYNLIAKNQFLNNDAYEAKLTCQKSIDISLKENDYANLAGSYFILSELYAYQGDYQASQTYFKLYTEVRDKEERLVYDNNTKLQEKINETSDLYATYEKEISDNEKRELELIRIKLEKEQREQEILLLKRESELAEKTLINQQLEKEQALKSIALLKAQLEQQNVQEKNTKLLKENEFRALKETNLKNEIALNQKEKNILEKDRRLQKLIIQDQEKQKLYLIFGISSLGGLFGLMLFMFLRNRKQAKIISSNNIALQSLSNELKNNNQKLEHTLVEVNEKNKIIEDKNYQIIESINYSKRIQDSFLLPVSELKTIFDDAGVIFKPRDIVSGDFYMVETIGEITYIALADCTGHGVPGALISIIGHEELSFLLRTTQSDISELLSALNQKINTLLNARDQIGSDGMDITLIKLDKKEQSLKIAGARSNCYLYLNKELIEFKGDRLSIGEKSDDPNFCYTKYTYNYCKGDLMYLMSDGYQDQFAEGKKVKFGKKQLRTTIEKITHEKVEKQINILETELKNWQGNASQIDDISLLILQL